MIRKFKRKLLALITMAVMLTAPMSVFASELPEDVSSSVVADAVTRDSSSFTMTLNHNSAQNVELHYMGFNPTVRVTATGNSNMTYRVWVVNPAGISGDVGYVRGDGSTIEKNLFLSIGGNYYVYVQPWVGSTNGQNVRFDFQVTW